MSTVGATAFVPEHRRIADGGVPVRQQIRAHREATRVVRLVDLTAPQRRLILALVAASRAA